MNEEMIPIITINRHRMMTDGIGVTSLVALPGCPLSCPYCLNQDILSKPGIVKSITIDELIKKLSIDHCYFIYTGGGVTFGGGEALLHSKELLLFSQKCPDEWNINIETSLNVPFENLEPLVNERFNFIIDIKAMQSDIYQSYTQMDNSQVLSNLKYISENLPENNYVVKVPRIPNYSTIEDVENSVRQLIEMGIPKENIATFDYVIRKS